MSYRYHLTPKRTLLEEQKHMPEVMNGLIIDLPDSLLIKILVNEVI